MKIFMVLCVLVFQLAAVAQKPLGKITMSNAVVVGEVKKAGLPLMQLFLYTKGVDSIYYLYFDDGLFNHTTFPKSIRIDETGGVLQNFYNVLIEALESKDRAPRQNSFGRHDMTIKARNGVVVVKTEKGSFKLTRKQVEQLFGRSILPES